MKGLFAGLTLLGVLIIFAKTGAADHLNTVAPAPKQQVANTAMSIPVNPVHVVYTQAQLQEALQKQGMLPGRAHIGSAIAEAESGGKSDAVHLCPPNCIPNQGPENSYGPWQINLQKHPTVTQQCAEDLNCAAHATYLISDYGQNWNPWSTYLNGAYTKWL